MGTKLYSHDLCGPLSTDPWGSRGKMNIKGKQKLEGFQTLNLDGISKNRN